MFKDPKPISHKWAPISDLPEDYLSMRNDDLVVAARRWLEVKPLLGQEILTRYLTRTKNEWAIELGNVENVYYIDEATMARLVEDGLYSQSLPEQGGAVDPFDPQVFFASHEEVYDALRDMADKDTAISQYLIRGLHAVLTENQHYVAARSPSGRKVNEAMPKGVYKKWPNYPTIVSDAVHQYCPPELVESELDRLLGYHAAHAENDVPAEIEAAWFHHRFIQIHPFQDGNGRVGRALATLIFLKSGFLPPIVKLKDKRVYLNHLNQADKGDLKPLVDYFASLVISNTDKCLEFTKVVTKKQPKPLP
jgi:Fic family protein